MKMAKWFRAHRHTGRRVLSGLLALVMTLGLAGVALPGVRARAEDGVASTDFLVTHVYLGDPVLIEEGWVDGEGNHDYTYTVEHDATPSISYYSEETQAYYIYPQPQSYLDESVGMPVTEEYSGYEIVDGNLAVNWIEPTGDGTGLDAGHFEIKYNAEVQTVRLYLFYSYNGMTVLGASFGAVFDGLTIDGVDVTGKDVLDVTDENREAIQAAIAEKGTDTLKEADLTTVERIYNTDSGLHTEKRVSPDVLEDGRTFDVSLESWYTANSNMADVGFILDSSGSMAFVPTGALDAFEHGDDKAYGATVWDKGYGPYVSLPAECWTNPSWVFSGNTDNSPLAYTNYSYYVYDSRDSVNELVPLAYWDGEMDGTPNPLLNGLVGLYQFDRTTVTVDDKETEAYFSDNGVTDDVEDTAVEGAHSKTSSDYKADNNGGSSHVTATPKNGALQVYDGKNIAHSTLDLDAVVPDPNNFTLSFAVKTDGTGVINEAHSKEPTGDGKGPQAEDLVTIKDAAGNELYTILRGTRSPGNSQDHVRWVGSDGTPVDVKKVFSASGDGKASYGKYTANSWLVFTFVVQDGHVTTYVDGTKATYTDGGKNTAEGDVSFGDATNLKFTLGGDDEFVSGPTLQIDEVYIYNRALSEDDGEVTKLVDTMKTLTGSVFTKEGEEHALIGGNKMDLNQASQFVALPQEKRAGWYYVNSTSTYGTIETTGSAKSLHGLPVRSDNFYPDNMGYKDEALGKNVLYKPYSLEDCDYEKIDYHGFYTYEESGCEAVPGKKVALTAGEKITTASPCILYFGRATPDDYAKGFVGQKEGEAGELILRCVFSPTGGTVLDSPVLFKADHNAALTKVQKLQVALNKFINRLQVDSPYSKVSAVRFSSDQYVRDDEAGTDREKELLLQTWTSDPKESTGMMSLNRGATETGMAKATDADGGLYNYVITGGTNAFTGLQAFSDYLAEAEDIKDDGASKYVILFTDGQDYELTTKTEDGTEVEIEDVKTTKAVALAEELRTKGYTIFTVQLVSGDTASSTSTKIPEFLEAITGDPKNCFTAKDADALDGAFNSIIEEMPFRLTGYSVRDYIDPRFDLVADTVTPSAGDAGVRTREIVHLHEGGTIHIGESDEASDHYDLTKDGGHEFYFSTAEKNDTEGAEGEATYTERYTKATLKYDEAKGLYYLEWTNQSIPLCQEGSNRLSVWSATITLRAKEDFIGGNAVLTNGPSTGENMVFHPDDETPNSGTDEAKLPAAEMPSKGFPRTQVNVKPYRMVTDPSVDVRYLGESMNPKEALSALLHNAEGEMRDLDHLNVTQEEWDNRDGSGYYYEYVKRYLQKHPEKYDGTNLDEDFDAFLDDLLAGTEVKLDYSFLPAVTGGGEHDHGTQTGGEAYEGDVLGTITYQWAAVTDGDGPLDDAPTAGAIGDPAPKRYQLTVTYTPTPVESRDEAPLIDDTAYATPKTPVGSVAVGDAAQALHTTYVASGRLALKAQAPTATLQKIVDEGGALNVTVEKIVDPAAGIAAMDAGDPAATLPFALTQDALDAAPEVNGAKTVYFIATDTLPMGSYTLGLTDPEPGEFTDLKGADGADYAWARFDLTVDGVTVDSYFAGSTPDTNTVTFQLGDTNAETRTSAREGLADKLAAWVDDKIAAAIADAPDEDAKKELRTSQKTLNDLGLDPTWDGAAELPAYLNARLGMGEVYMTLTPPVEVTLTTAKTFENASQNDQPVRFTFTLTPEEEGADVLTATVAYDPSAGEETQTVTFDPLVFLRPGTYTYTLAEEQETLDRVTFDETEHEVQIAVSDSGVTVTVDGTAYAETKDASEADSGSRYTFDLAPAIAFTNTYKPAVGMLIIHKVVAGDGAPTSDETYTFEVNSDPVQTVTIEGSGSAELELAPGAYTVTELTTGESFTTTVDDVETDQAEVAVPLDGTAEVTFTNTYEKVEPPAPTTGKLTIRKVVTGDGAPNPDEVYTFEVSDGLDSQTVNIEGNGSAELELAPGTYTVTELTTGDFTTTVDGVEDKTTEVTVPENGEAEVTFTNTYEQTEPPTPATGKLTIRKVVINPPTPAETYAFEVSDGLDSQTVNIEGSGSAELELEPGTYTVTELTTGDFTTTVDDVEINQAEITVPENGEVEVTFTNTYEQTEPPTPATGKLTIRKAVVNPPTPAETYTFEISTDPVQTVTIEGSGSRTLDLEPGTYTVTEVPSGDFTTTVDGAEVNQAEITVPESGEVEVTFTNTYEKAGPTTPPAPATGKLTIRKVVAGDDKPTPAATYTFEVGTDPVRTVTIEGSGSRTLELEPGTYTVTELTTGESFTTTVDGVETAQAEVTVPLGDTVEVTFTNTYQQTEPPTPSAPPTPTTGDLTISKTVTGTAGDRSREWHFHLTLGDASIDGVYGDMAFKNGVAEFTLKSGQSKTAMGLPAGVTYAVTETEADRDGYKTSSTGATGTIPQDGAAAAAFVNAKPSVATGYRPSVATGSSGQTTPAPSETPVPSETPIPSETPAPDGTPAPSDTPIPSETPAPDGTPAPDETPIPGEIPAPGETPAPGDTPALNETSVPEETPAPDETPKTGDDRHLGLWTALLLLSAVGAAVTLWPATWQKDRGGKGRRGRK